jgi:1-acyl-sn-glycerol-3-phosphate acyltransferase
MSGNYLPRNPLAEWVGRTALRLMGWRIEGELPPLDKFVVIGAHHTSNWDFVIFIAAKFVLRLNARWFGKHTIFRWPFGGLMRLWGGIAIQRERQGNTVEQAVRAFAEHEQFVLILSPEGTRKKVERWKMGFYHIALGAGVPIVLGVYLSGRPLCQRGMKPLTLRRSWRFSGPLFQKNLNMPFVGIDGRHADNYQCAVIVSLTAS